MVDLLADAQRFPLLLRERFDLADARKVVVQRGVELAQLMLSLAESRANLFGKAAHRQDNERDGHQGQQGQLPAHGKQDDADADQGDHIDEHVRDRMRNQPLEHVGVVDHARHELAGLFVLVEAQRKPLQMLVDVLAGLRHDAPTRHMRHVGAHELQHRAQRVQPQQQQRQPRHEGHRLLVPAGLGRHSTDQRPDDPGHHQLHAHQDEHADHGQSQRHEITPGVGQEKLQSPHGGSFQCAAAVVSSAASRPRLLRGHNSSDKDQCASIAQEEVEKQNSSRLDRFVADSDSD